MTRYEPVNEARTVCVLALVEVALMLVMLFAIRLGLEQFCDLLRSRVVKGRTGANPILLEQFPR